MQRYFITAESTYESLRQSLNTQLGYPNALGKSVFQTALLAPRDGLRRVLLAVDTDLPGYATISAAIDPLLTSDAMEEIDQATYLAAIDTAGAGGTVTISDVSGLQTALDGKAAASHGHTGADITLSPNNDDPFSLTDPYAADFLLFVGIGSSSPITAVRANAKSACRALIDAAAASHTHSAAQITDFTSAVIAAAPPTTDASLLTTGTLSASRLPASGVSASSLTTGTLPDARLSANVRQASDNLLHPFLLAGM